VAIFSSRLEIDKPIAGIPDEALLVDRAPSRSLVRRTDPNAAASHGHRRRHV
jgi:hypothetical protein